MKQLTNVFFPIALLLITCFSNCLGQSSSKAHIFQEAKEETKKVIADAGGWELVSFKKTKGYDWAEGVYVLDCEVVCRATKHLIKGGFSYSTGGWSGCDLYHVTSMGQINTSALNQGAYYQILADAEVTFRLKFTGRKHDDGWHVRLSEQCSGNIIVSPSNMAKTITHIGQAKVILVTPEMRVAEQRAKEHERELHRGKLDYYISQNIYGKWVHKGRVFFFKRDGTFTLRGNIGYGSGSVDRRYYAGTWQLIRATKETNPVIKVAFNSGQYTNNEEFRIDLAQSSEGIIVTQDNEKLFWRGPELENHDYILNCHTKLKTLQADTPKPTYDDNEKTAFLEYMAVGDWCEWYNQKKLKLLTLNQDRTARYKERRVDITGVWSIRSGLEDTTKTYYLDIKDRHTKKILKSFTFADRDAALEVNLCFVKKITGLSHRKKSLIFWRDLNPEKIVQETTQTKADTKSTTKSNNDSAREVVNGQALYSLLLGTWQSEDGETIWQFTDQGCTKIKDGKKKSGRWYLNLRNGYLEYQMQGIVSARLPLGFARIKGDRLIIHRTRDFVFTRVR